MAVFLSISTHSGNLSKVEFLLRNEGLVRWFYVEIEMFQTRAMVVNALEYIQRCIIIDAFFLENRHTTAIYDPYAKK